MTEFCSKITQEPVLYIDGEEAAYSKPRYEVTFSTSDRRYFNRVEKACRACIDKTATDEVPEYVDTKIKTNNTDDDKTFDIVDAFMHLIWGRKVRMTHWDKDEYIGLAECKLQIGEKWIIRNNGQLYPAELLFNKDSIEARWEDYKEENENG
jgi:hypothetical protein